MSLWQKAFLAHPASVNETYLEHLQSATGFGTRMILSGLACLVHGLVPCCFVRTGSNQIRQLYGRMVVDRADRSPSVMIPGAAAHGRTQR
jgi:Family of unknown function (DUF6356)